VEEGSVFSKATPVTHVNGSQLEASAVDSRESDKYIINQSQKNLGFSQNPVPLQKSSPFMSVVQSNHFP
jgi:hypothetical protein